MLTRTGIILLTALLAVAPASVQAAPAGGRYALLVGVRQYDRAELTSLDYPENDVTGLGELLRTAGYRRVVLMTQKRGAFEARYLPLAANIRRELRGLLEDRTENDIVVVAFCGHGVQFAGSDEPYFCPMDTKLSDRNSLISLSEVYAQLKNCKARVKLLVSDACRNDPLPRITRSALQKQVFSPTTSASRLKPPENVVALFSCSAGEAAYESTRLKHGVFFHFLIEGLRGKATSATSKEVTLGTLVDYVQREVRDFVKEEVGARIQQRPELVGRYSGAVTLLELNSKVRRNDPRALRDLTDQALAHFRKREYRPAVEVLERALKIDPENPLALAMRAHALDSLGQHTRALEDANRAIKLDPTISAPYHTRGNVYLAKKRTAQAISQYTEAIRRYGAHVSAHYNRGRAHAQNREYDQAVSDYTQALRIDPKFASAYHARGLIHMVRRRPDDALKDFNQAIACNRTFALVYADRGLIYAIRGDDTTALADYNEAIRLDDRQALPYHLRGNLRARQKDYTRAVADYTEAIRRRQHYTRALYNRGLTFFAMKDYSRAMKDLTEVVRIAPTHAGAFNARGACHARQNRHSQALADYNRAIKLDATDPLFFENRGKIYRKLGNRSRSSEDLAMAKKLTTLRDRKGNPNR